MREIWKKVGLEYKDFIFLGLSGLGIGALVAVLEAVFGWGLTWCTQIRTAHFFPLIFFLPVAGLGIVFLYKRVGQKATKGMSLVFQVGLGEEAGIPARMAPLAIGCTWMTHLFGGSAGREGVAIQIGAAVSSNVERLLGKWWRLRERRQIFLITGMAAGFAGLFRTPLTAVFFAMEVLVVGEMEYSALFPAAVAAVTSDLLAGRLGVAKFHQEIPLTVGLDLVLLLKLALLGILFGLAGFLFSEGLCRVRRGLQRLFMDHPYRRIAIMGVLVAVLMILLWQGRYSGTGANLVQACFSGEEIYWYDWLLKGLMTILTLASGFVGGEVAPLFSIGASLGFALAGLWGIPASLAAALGYAAVFGSGTNTLLAAILVGGEVFGYGTLPYMAVTCIMAYLVNRNHSIFSAQRIHLHGIG